MPIRQMVRAAALIAFATAAFLTVAPSNAADKQRKASQRASSNVSPQAASLAAWPRIAAVLQHPRCLNCHQLESPLQGDSRRAHIPHVVRGPDNHGIGAMRCGNCHNDMGNNVTSRTPGGPHWQLAPVSMLWQGLSSAELCRMLKDPTRNGNRKPEALVEHMEKEPLVLWGWDPGPGVEPVPTPHAQFVGLMRTWVAGGAACPNEQSTSTAQGRNQ
jgi:hypothetical protein